MRSRVSPDIGGDGHFFPIVLLRWRLLTRVKIRWRQKQLVEPFFFFFSLYCTLLHHTAPYCTILHFFTGVWEVQYGAVWCSMMVFDKSENLHNVIHNYTVPLHYQAVGTLENQKFVLPCFFGKVQYGAVWCSKVE